MAPAVTRLISSPSSTLSSLLSFRPEPPFLNAPKHQNQQLLNHGIKFRRRDSALLSFLSLMPSLSHPDPANAFSIGICTEYYSLHTSLSLINHRWKTWLIVCYAAGPKDWLKEQKKKSSKFLLAPVDASRQILNSAYLSLSKVHSLLSTFLVYRFNEFN